MMRIMLKLFLLFCFNFNVFLNCNVFCIKSDSLEAIDQTKDSQRLCLGSCVDRNHEDNLVSISIYAQ